MTKTLLQTMTVAELLLAVLGFLFSVSLKTCSQTQGGFIYD